MSTNKSPAHTTAADTGMHAVVTRIQRAREGARQPLRTDAPGVLMCARAHNWLGDLVGLDCSVQRIEELRGRVAGIADAIKEGRGDEGTHAHDGKAGRSQQAQGRGQCTHSEPLAGIKAKDEIADGIQALSNNRQKPSAKVAHESLLDVEWLLDLLPPSDDDGADMWLDEPQGQEAESDVLEGHGLSLRFGDLPDGLRVRDHGLQGHAVARVVPYRLHATNGYAVFAPVIDGGVTHIEVASHCRSSAVNGGKPSVEGDGCVGLCHSQHFSIHLSFNASVFLSRYANL